MELFDSHTHLYLEAFDNDRKNVVEAARKMGIQRMTLPNIDASTLPALQRLAGQFPEACLPAIGLHPGSVGANYREELENIQSAFAEDTFVAIGEIGIDLYRDQTYRREQTEVFKVQVEWASELGLPIIIHMRNSFDEIVNALDELGPSTVTGVFHSFTGNRAQAKRILDMGFYLGINGILTFKNSGLQDVVNFTGLEKIVLETDSPFLAPVPHRGERNESSYLLHIARKLAGILSISLNEVASTTTNNSKALFQINQD